MIQRFFLFLKGVFSDNDRDLTKGSISGATIYLAVPMILELAMESLFAVVDIFFVGKLGVEAVAVVGLTETVMTLIYSLAIGMGMAATALVARRIGEGDKIMASKSAAHAIGVGAVFGAFFSIVAGYLAPHILQLMGASEQVIAMGADYTRISFFNTVNIVLLFVINGIFRGAGKAFIAMRVLWIANAVNIVLDPLLIFGIGPFPELGLEGAAIATFAGRMIGVLVQVYILSFNKPGIHIVRESMVYSKKLTLKFLKISSGGIGQFFIESASWILLIRIVSEFGDATVAGYTFAVRVLLFVILPSWGFSNAASTMVGQNLGANRPDRAESSVWYAVKVNTIFLSIVGVLMLVFSHEIIGLFTDSEEALAIGSNGIKTFGVLFFFFGAGMVLPQAYNGAGETKTPTIVNFICFWVVQLMCAYLLAFTFDYGINGIFASILIADITHMIVFYFLFKGGSWKGVKV